VIRNVRPRLGTVDLSNATIEDYQPGGALYSPGDTYTPGAPINIMGSGGGGGSDWAQFGAVLATDAAQLARPFIQSQLPAPQYVQGQYGAQVLYNPQTGEVTQAKQTLPSGLDARGGSGVFGMGSSLPLLVIAGLAVLLVMGEAKK
jgi:hypothetical protein